MDKRSNLILITVFLVSVLLCGCGGYKPPYDRGYEAGYAAGVAAAGGSVSEGAVADTAPAKSALTSMTSKTEDEASEEVSEASSEEAGTEEAEHGGTVSGSEVLGEGSKRAKMVFSNGWQLPKNFQQVFRGFDAPAPFMATFISLSFLPASFAAFMTAAETTTAVPCWSS